MITIKEDSGPKVHYMWALGHTLVLIVGGGDGPYVSLLSGRSICSPPPFGILYPQKSCLEIKLDVTPSQSMANPAHISESTYTIHGLFNPKALGPDPTRSL